MARTKANIDWDRVEQIAMAGANGRQIAAAIGIHYNTLERRCKEDLNSDFSEFLQTKREKGDHLLLMKQYDLAMQGDRGMLIWLGKQRLGQRERSEYDMTTNKEPITPIIQFINGDSDSDKDGSTSQDT